MSAPAVVFFLLKICSMTFFLILFSCPNAFGLFIWPEDRDTMHLLNIAAKELIQSTYGLMDSVEHIKQQHLNTPGFEVGYVMFTLFEKYRKMIDKYNSSLTMGRYLYMFELMMYLEEIEVHHWEVEHMSNMLHEIERKYAVKTGLHGIYKELTSKERRILKRQEKQYNRDKRMSTTKKYKIKQKVLDRLTPTTPKSTVLPFHPRDYATESLGQLRNVLNGSIYNDLSWPVKMLLIKDRLNLKKISRTGPEEIPTDGNATIDVTKSTAAAPSANPHQRRRMPPIEAFVAERRQEPAKDPNEDDNSMRLKLFRLMYETIRDSDRKCKRAELIRSNYENSSTFEVGYLMGDVMDKYNIMSDISMTLNRLFHEWKPIEHINAYEQISNQAIEINHLIEMMKGISKKNETTKSLRL